MCRRVYGGVRACMCVHARKRGMLQRKTDKALAEEQESQSTANGAGSFLEQDVHTHPHTSTTSTFCGGGEDRCRGEGVGEKLM